MDDLLREAIADAKAVRETALENAKIALEEAFTPRLQSMLSRKIAAEAEDSEEMMDKDEMEAEEEMDADEMKMNSDEMEDKDEMDAEEMMDKEEGEDHEEMRGMDEEEAEENDAEESEMDEMEDKDEEEAEEMRETEDKDENEDEMSEMEDKDEDEKMDEAEDAEEEEMDEDELDLESVLAELEKDLDDEDQVDEEYKDGDVEDGMNKDEVEVDDEKLAENDVSSDIGKSDNKVNAKANDSSSVGQGPESEGSDKKAGDELSDHETVDNLIEVEDKDEEDLDLDEVLRALTEEDAEEEDAEENEKLKSEIKEHRKVIHFMRSKLNEVNLLNAKLLFSNKLFRAFGLNNNQKLKVVENFDRTTNLREVKLVYATLAESFKRPSKLSESVVKGSSSKPVASTKTANAEVLSEGQELKARFKKLANIL